MVTPDRANSIRFTNASSFVINEISTKERCPLMRPRHWKMVRRVCAIAIILVTNLSLFLNQTQATMEIDRWLNGPPAKVVLGAGFWAHTVHNVGSMVNTMSTFLASCYPSGSTGTIYAPPGTSLPWQRSIPAGPFSTVNTATGNVLTEVHIVDWNTLGRTISFSLFHNSMPADPDCVPGLPYGWRHSYSRRLHMPGGTEYTLITDEGNHIPLEKTSSSPPTLESMTGLYLKAIFNASTSEWELTYKNQNVDYFNSQGRLIRVADAAQTTHTLTYSTNDPSCSDSARLTAITEGACQNALSLEYDNCAGETCCADTDREGCLSWVHAPDIGRPGVEEARDYEISTSKDEMHISRARRNGTAAAFTASFYMSGHRITDVVDYLGTSTHYAYNTDGSILFMTQDYGATTPLTTIYSQIKFAHNPSDGPYEVMRRFEVYGYRVTPSQPLTEYCYDGVGRLVAVTDPLGRQVVDLTWSKYNLLETSTNVFGGVTQYTSYDANGNLKQMIEPNGAEWNYTYDSLNNMTSCTDPYSHVTALSYGDSTNPTKPTLIDGPGVSDMTMAWGADSHNLGKLTESVSPNGIYQEFFYGDATTPGSGTGHLRARTFGRWQSGQGVASIADGLFAVDCTGNTYMSERKSSTIDSDVEDFDEDDTDDEIDPWKPQAQCSIDYDADGNPTSHCNDNCVDGPAGSESNPDPAGGAQPFQPSHIYNGNNQPLQLRQYTRGPASVRNDYQFDYDAYGRPVYEMLQTSIGDATAGTWHQPFNSSQLHQWMPHFYADPGYSVDRTYDDEAGVAAWEYAYFPASGAPAGSTNTPTPIYREITTDLAGRVTSIESASGPTATYQYQDSTTLPAVTEYKNSGTITTEYYLDTSGQVSTIIHKGYPTTNELLAFTYTRDLRHRITKMKEYHNGVLHSETEYVYGSGNLTAGELDSTSTPDPEKYYYNWFSSYTDQMSASDPNRLVKEIRRGGEAYNHEYRYDAGGNRLAMIKWEDVNLGVGEEDFRPVEITRYNYAKAPNLIQPGTFDGFDPRMKAASAVGLGDPLPPGATIDTPDGGAPYVATVTNDYNEIGQDKLISYRVQPLYAISGEPKGSGQYVAYQYRVNGGEMSERYSYDIDNEKLTTTTFSYEKNQIESVQTFMTVWTDAPAPGYSFSWNDTQYDEELEAYVHVFRPHAELEVFKYDIFGRRVAVQWCSTPSGPSTFTCDDEADIYVLCPNAPCKQGIHTFNYVGGDVIERRGGNDFYNTLAYKTVSHYESGAMGMFARTYRNTGFSNPCPSGCTPETCGDPGPCENCVAPCTPPADEFCRMYMLNDSMGNVSATMDDTVLNTASYQVFDAFGNRMGSGTVLACNGSEPQLASGRMQWRGGEGTMTDYNGDYIAEGSGTSYGDWPEEEEQYTRQVASGLVFMKARMYESATGRFTQADAMPYQMLDFLTGQNNRWAYCGNDPVNISDPSGNAWPAVLLIIAVVALLLMVATWILSLWATAMKNSCINNPNLEEDWADLADWFDKLGALYGIVGAIAGLLGAGVTGLIAILKFQGDFLELAYLIKLAPFAAILGGVAGYTMADAVYDWVYN